MFEVILSTLYFFLPAYVANMCPVIAAALHLPFGIPVHEHWFGAHKTFRGLYAGILGALLVVLLQSRIQNFDAIAPLVLLRYTAENIFLFGFLMGFGVIAGDMAKSYAKRRLGRRAGTPWFPFDQLDFVIGALVLTYPIFQLDGPRILVLLILTPLLHFLTNVTGYLLGLKKVWW